MPTPTPTTDPDPPAQAGGDLWAGEPDPSQGEPDNWRNLSTAYQGRFRARRDAWEKSFLGRMGRTAPMQWLHRQRMGFSVAIGLLIAGATAFLATSAFRGRETPVITPAPQSATAAVIKTLPPYDEIILRAEKSIAGYFAARKWRDRLPYVRERAIVEPLMRARYKDILFVPEPSPTLESPQVILSNGQLQLAARARYSHLPVPGFLVAVETAEGWQIDWEITSGYQAIPWAEFSAQRLTSPSYFRVLLMPDGYHNFEFSDASVHACYRFSLVGTDQTLYAYVSKRSALAEKLLRATKPRDWKPMILALRYPPGSHSADQVEITEFLQEKWLVDYAKRGGHFDPPR